MQAVRLLYLLQFCQPTQLTSMSRGTTNLRQLQKDLIDTDQAFVQAAGPDALKRLCRTPDHDRKSTALPLHLQCCVNLPQPQIALGYRFRCLGPAPPATWGFATGICYFPILHLLPHHPATLRCHGLVLRL